MRRIQFGCRTDPYPQYEFAITGAIGKKPFIKDNADEPPVSSPSVKRSPGYVPGSDIDVSGYEITYVNGTHLLMFNKFCMYRPHLLLLTKDGYRRQYEQLDLQDLQAVWNVLQSLNWRYFMFFNCGKDGGCSRLHVSSFVMAFSPRDAVMHHVQVSEARPGAYLGEKMPPHVIYRGYARDTTKVLVGYH